jgi:hypothetical protein
MWRFRAYLLAVKGASKLTTRLLSLICLAVPSSSSVVEFKETSIFTKQIEKLLSLDEIVEFEQHLITNPEVGDIIVGGHGLRKVRWAVQGRGKSGGIR